MMNIGFIVLWKLFFTHSLFLNYSIPLYHCRHSFSIEFWWQINDIHHSFKVKANYKKIMVTSSESRILTYYDISCNLYWKLQYLQSYHVVKQWSALQHPISIATLLLVVVLGLSIELSVWLFNTQTNIFFRIYHKLTSCFPIPVF